MELIIALTKEAQKHEELPAPSAEETEINYSVFGLCPLSDILETGKRNVSETAFVSVLMSGVGVP
jgi:hypothetical protein